ncbi:MAG: amino acid permease [Myxococcota bacterium]
MSAPIDGPPARPAPPGSTEQGAHPLDRLPRSLSLWDATMLIVASVVGSGIFFTPAQVVSLLPSAGPYLLVWIVGALISLVGAFVNAELGAMFPRAGGDYVYLREGLHPAAGFLAGWLSFFAIYAGTIAALAVVVAELVAPALGLGRAGILAFASALVLAMSLVHLLSTRLGAGFNNLASLLKLAAIAAFVIAGPLFGDGSFAPWRAGALPPMPGGDAAGPVGGGGLALRFGQALSPVLFSYLGWNASVFVASEIRDPQRNVPRSLFLGLGLCTLLYLAINAIYLYALTPAEMAAARDTGQAAARALFGETGGRWVAGFVMLSVLGTLSAQILIGPRIVYAMALDEQFLARASRVHAKFLTPAVAIALQAGIAIGLILVLESFPKALDFTVFCILLATAADTLALFRLRRRRPELARPYRAFGHPWLSLGYLGVIGATAVAIARASPRECAVAIAMLLAGLLLYWPVRAGRAGRDAGSGTGD